MNKHYSKSKIKYLTVKEIKSIRGGRVAIVFKQHESPYELSARDAKNFEVGMRVCIIKGKIFPC